MGRQRVSDSSLNREKQVIRYARGEGSTSGVQISKTNFGDDPSSKEAVPSRSTNANPDEELLSNIDLSSDEFVDDVIADADLVMRGPIDVVSISQAESSNVKSPSRKLQLVLIGAGHAHLQIVNWWPEHRISGVELILVSAFDRAAYSGMLPGTLAGLYRPEEMLIDLPSLCQMRGVRLIVDRANSLDPVLREIEFAHQPMLRFDLASINIGSVPTSEALWQSHRIMISAKPLATFVDRFLARFQELVEQWNQAPGPEMLQVVVVGGGVAGVELAFCLEQRRYELELPIDVRVVDGHTSVLKGSTGSLIRKVKKLFRKRGIETTLGSRVVDCDDLGPSSLILDNGNRIRADLVVWATGAAPPMAIQGFQLPKSPLGFLKIRPTLQSTADVPVFIVGDVADLLENPLPKSGVQAALQAKTLLENIQRWFSARPLVTYQPKPPNLSFVNCGDRTAILSYKGFCFHGQWVWWLKDRIDRKWVSKFQMK